MPKRPTIEERLAAAGKDREQARAEAAIATAEIRKLAPRALKAGVPKTEIARLARISRPALDEMLK